MKQSQPPVIMNNKYHKLPNVQQQFQLNYVQNKQRNHSLKKISYYQGENGHNGESQSLNSLGLFPKIEQKAKQRHSSNIYNQLAGEETSLQKPNQAKWNLPNSLMKKRQKLLTQGNNINKQILGGNESFISLNSNNNNNHKIMLPTDGDSTKDTMVDFRKKIELNRLFIKKEIEKKNKENSNNDSRVKKQGSMLLIDNNKGKKGKQRKERVASSRFVMVDDSNDGVEENNIVVGLIKDNGGSKDCWSQSKRTIETPSINSNKLQGSFVKRKSQSNKKKKNNFSSNNRNNNKNENKNFMKAPKNNNANNNSNNINNKMNKISQRKRQKTQQPQPSSSSIDNNNNNNQNNNNKTPYYEQKQQLLPKRKSQGLFGELQVILDEKMREDVSKQRILQQQTRLRELLLKLSNKHKHYDENCNNNNNYREKHHSHYEVGSDNISNNNNANYHHHSNNNQYGKHNSTQSFHHANNHMSLQSSSQQTHTLLQSTDTLSLAQSGAKLKQYSNHQQWHKLQLEATTQISYRKSSFEHELNKINQYADRNDASLQKYLGMRKQLMKLGFQMQFGFNQNSRNLHYKKKHHQKNSNICDMQRDKENNNN